MFKKNAKNVFHSSRCIAHKKLVIIILLQFSSLARWFVEYKFDTEIYNSNVFQLPEGRMLTYFGIVPEGSLLDVPNAALGTYLNTRRTGLSI